jgi:hypothetical protein
MPEHASVHILLLLAGAGYVPWLSSGITTMVFTGGLMIWQERGTMVGWFGQLGR